MWSAGSKRVNVFVGERMLGIERPGAASLWFEVTSPHEALALAQEKVPALAAVRAPRRNPVHLFLSAALARPFIVPPVAGLRNAAEAHAVAESMCDGATGFGGGCRIWLDDWRAGQSCLAVAVEQAWIDELESQTKAQRLVIQSISPWWSTALNACLAVRESPMLIAIDDGEALTLLSGSGREYSSASTYERPSKAQAELIVSRAMVVAEQATGAAMLVRRRGRGSDGAQITAAYSELPVAFGAEWVTME